MQFSLGNINWLAVVAAAIVMFIIGGVWYAALFAKSWPMLHEFSEARMASSQSRFALNMVVIFAGDFVRALVLALLIQAMHTSGLVGGVQAGLLVWLGFTFTYDLGWALSSSTAPKAFAIDSSYRLLCLVVAGGVLASWQKAGAAAGVPATS